MRKAAALLLIAAATSFATASDWQCNQAGAAMEATTNEFARADGVQVFLVSDTFLFIAAACPEEFFRHMKPDVFNVWVSKLEQRTFRVTEEEGEQTETFLSRLQRKLKKLRFKDPQQEGMRERLLTEVASMCVRVVDHDKPVHPCRRK